MKVKFLPLDSFYVLEETINRNILCVYVKAGIKGVEFLGLPRSTAYRRLARLRALGFKGEGLYVPYLAVDHSVRFLKRPLFLLSAKGCVYVPRDCSADCPSCPLHSAHSRLLNLFFSTPHLWPADILNAVVEKALDKLKGGLEVDL